MSGLASSKNSNRPSKASDTAERQLSQGIGDSVFEKAAVLLQQYNNNYDFPPRPNVTFCNVKEGQQVEEELPNFGGRSSDYQ